MKKRGGSVPALAVPYYRIAAACEGVRIALRKAEAPHERKAAFVAYYAYIVLRQFLRPKKQHPQYKLRIGHCIVLRHYRNAVYNKRVAVRIHTPGGYGFARFFKNVNMAGVGIFAVAYALRACARRAPKGLYSPSLPMLQTALNIVYLRMNYVLIVTQKMNNVNSIAQNRFMLYN